MQQNSTGATTNAPKNSSTNQNYQAKQRKHGQNINHPILEICVLIHISDKKK